MIPDRDELERKARAVLGRSLMVETEWCIISGPPCSGKTTVIEQLKRRGFPTNPDLSREYFREQREAGIATAALRSTGENLHRELFLRMLLNAASLSPDELIFHDYGLPDNVAFRIADGFGEDADLTRSCELFRYRKVFILEPAPFMGDDARVEDATYQARIATALPGVYRRLGYEPVAVPLISPEKRCALILGTLRSAQNSPTKPISGTSS